MHACSQGAVASARTRYRFVDFLDEACPISSEDGEGEATDNDHPSGSGEEDAGPMAVDEPQLLPESICMSLPGPSTCSYLSVGQVGSNAQAHGQVHGGVQEHGRRCHAYRRIMVCGKYKFLTLHNAGLRISGCGLMIAEQHTWHQVVVTPGRMQSSEGATYSRRCILVSQLLLLL